MSAGSLLNLNVFNFQINSHIIYIQTLIISDKNWQVDELYSDFW